MCWRRAFSVSSLGFSVWACSATAANEPPLFGGEGANVKQAPTETPLEPGASAQANVDAGPCTQAAPPGDRLEIDDFEDNDHKIFKVFEREGWWYTATDGTEGEKVEPPRGTFAPTLLPKAESGPENEYAAHLSASGQQDWGVVWGTTLKWIRQGVGCPFNASSFAGIEFRAKGPATIWVNFNTPLTTPPENGGTCKEKCWDSYGKLIRIKEGWNLYVVRWDQLQQQGFGTDVRFDNTRLLNLNFSAKTEFLPMDFWIDDIRFLGQGAAAAPDTNAPAAHGSGTASTPAGN